MPSPTTLFSTVLIFNDLSLFLIYNDLIAIFSILISFIGYLVLIYVINLRLDALLYARTINAIRKSFFDASGLELSKAFKGRTLPQSSSHPSYVEHSYFFPVIFCFAIFNTMYFYLGFYYFDSNVITTLILNISTP